MLRAALGLLSSVQIGVRLKAKLEAAVRQSAVAAIGIAILLMAAAFGLVCGYHALTDVYGFTPLQGSGLIACALLLLAILVLVTIPLFGPRRAKPKPQALFDAGTDGLAMADQSLNKAMKQVGPLTLLAVAFSAGLLASRRR